MTRDALDAQILAAHHDDDREALAVLYATAADQAEQAGDIERACYFLTQAWIFALHAGCANADELRRRLACHGRA